MEPWAWLMGLGIQGGLPSLKIIKHKENPKNTLWRSVRRRKELLDESQLVKKLKEGSEEAFLELFEQYKARILSVVYRIVGNTTEGEDVVQEVFIKAYKNIGSFHFKSTFYTWLYRIAVNAAIDYKKKFQPQGIVSIHCRDGKVQEIPSPAESPDRGPQQKEMALILREALDQLTEKHKTILILREFEGLSYEEIAEVLDCSKGTVESRLFRARNRLREKMERFI